MKPSCSFSTHSQPLDPELVCLELVEQPNAPPFLIEIDDHAAALGRDEVHRRIELPAAVTAQRLEDIAGETIRVDANQRVLAVSDLAVDERDMLLLVDVVLVADDPPRAMIRRQPRFGDRMHKALVLEAMGHDLRYGDERDSVLLRELLELWAPRRCPVLVENLANHTRRQPSSQPRDPRRFRMSDALQDAAVPRAQGKDVATVTEIARRRGRVDGDADRRRAILGANARRHAEARRRVDGDRVRGAIIVEIRLAHEIELNASTRSPVSARQIMPPAFLI